MSEKNFEKIIQKLFHRRTFSMLNKQIAKKHRLAIDCYALFDKDALSSLNLKKDKRRGAALLLLVAFFFMSTNFFFSIVVATRQKCNCAQILCACMCVCVYLYEFVCNCLRVYASKPIRISICPFFFYSLLVFVYVFVRIYGWVRACVRACASVHAESLSTNEQRELE